MKTLYEQLTEEQKAVIKKHSIKFPAITEYAVEEMKKIYVVTKLTLENALNIYNIFYPSKGFDFCRFYELFEN